MRQIIKDDEKKTSWQRSLRMIRIASRPIIVAILPNKIAIPIAK